MESNKLQQAFFTHIKSKIPGHISLVDEVAGLLGISNDSAYRRIRGEKIISLDEISKMAAHFKVSVDQILNLQLSDSMVFSGKFVRPETFDFDMHLQQMLKDFMFLNSFRDRHHIYFCKDIVFFYFFAYPELAAFKNFAWMKTLFQFPVFTYESFQLDIFEKSLQDTCVKIARQHTIMPGSEIMNVSNIHTTINQVEYYKTARIVRSDDLKIIYRQLHEAVDHLQAQAEIGLKFMPGEKANNQSPEYNLYANDFNPGDNSQLFILNGSKISYMTHTGVNYMATRDEKYTAYHYDHLKNVMEKSTLLSKSGEMLRANFFYLIHEEIEKSQANQLKSFGKY